MTNRNNSHISALFVLAAHFLSIMRTLTFEDRRRLWHKVRKSMIIPRITKIFALCVAILVCSSLEAPFKFQSPGTLNFADGVMQPFASSPQYDSTETEARQQLTIDERIQGTSSAPAGGVGLMQSWSF
jgi:hypothetical protein